MRKRMKLDMRQSSALEKNSSATRTRIPRWVYLVLVAAIITVGAVTSIAASDVSGAWYHGTGTQHYEYGDGLPALDRKVDAWIAPDGRYRVVIESANGPAEEFLFDGTEALVFVTPPGQDAPASVSMRQTARIIVVDGHPHHERMPTDPEYPAVKERDAFSNLVTFVRQDGMKGAYFEMEMNWTRVEPSPAQLKPSPSAAELLAKYIFDEANAETGADMSTKSVSSNSATFWDNIFTRDACVFAKNYRDAEDSYLRAYSSKRGLCERVGVTLWHGSQIAQGLCQPYGILASAESATGYVNRTRYTAWNTPTCTSHAAYWDGYLVVNYSGLSTNPWSN